MDPILAAFRTQLRLRLRALSTWGFCGLGILLTAWGTLLDILAVGVEEGRPRAIAHASGGLVGLFLGGWIGSSTPERQSLSEFRGPWVALAGASWALPLARCATAAVLAALASVLCMLYTLVLSNYIPLVALLRALLAAALGAFLAASWAAFLAPRIGSLAAVTGVLALAALAQTSVPAALRPILPVTFTPDGLGAVPALACALSAAGLLVLTPRSPRADGGTDPAT